MKLLSWNVNGLRALYKKGFLEWLAKEKPDILCLQETKSTEDQLPAELRNVPGYYSYFISGNRKGHGGVGLFARKKPERLSFGLGIEDLDDEGRAIVADYGDFILFDVYFPNGKASKERLQYKLKFYDLFLKEIDRLKEMGRGVIVCGDVNTAIRRSTWPGPSRMKRYPASCLWKKPGWISWLSTASWTPFECLTRMEAITPGGI